MLFFLNYTRKFPYYNKMYLIVFMNLIFLCFIYFVGRKTFKSSWRQNYSSRTAWLVSRSNSINIRLIVKMIRNITKYSIAVSTTSVPNCLAHNLQLNINVIITIIWMLSLLLLRLKIHCPSAGSGGGQCTALVINSLDPPTKHTNVDLHSFKFKPNPVCHLSLIL